MARTKGYRRDKPASGATTQYPMATREDHLIQLERSEHPSANSPQPIATVSVGGFEFHNPRVRRPKIKHLAKNKKYYKEDRRFKSKTSKQRIMNEIRHYQAVCHEKLIPLLPFTRLVKEIFGVLERKMREELPMINPPQGYRIQKEALDALQTAAEDYLTHILSYL